MRMFQGQKAQTQTHIKEPTLKHQNPIKQEYNGGPIYHQGRGQEDLTGGQFKKTHLLRGE